MIDGTALAHARTVRGLSQRRLAALSGLNYQVIRRIERGGDDGNLTLREFQQLCTALATEPIHLMTKPRNAGPAETSAVRDPEELNLAQATLLRRIQRGEDIRRQLSSTERETVLPGLVRRGLIRVAQGGCLVLTTASGRDLGRRQRAT